MSNDVNDKLFNQGFGISKNAGPGMDKPLFARNVFPPFSTWNTREGRWLDRRRRWAGLGIESEIGRDVVTYNIAGINNYQKQGKSKGAKTQKSGDNFKPDKGMKLISIFDPVVCELAYRWWAKPGDIVLDPFAGGSVRGIVASVMGLKYYGIELREEQVVANRAQINDKTTGKFKPRWVVGDSLVEAPKAPECDFIFSCPPYGDLEVYSDDEADISNKGYARFLELYREIIAASVARLKEDTFAVWVVGNYRDKKTGRMLDFVGDSVRAFEDAGMSYYNDIVLINSVGTGSLRANTSFLRGRRKMVKLHQNVLVFYKGDWKKAADRLPQDLANYS